MNYLDSYKKRNTIKITSEDKCELFLKHNNIPFFHFGFSSKILDQMKIKKNYYNLDFRLQKQPDYLAFNVKKSKYFFIECKSFDKELNVRLKFCDLKGYKYWNYFLNVYVFIYSFKENKHIIIQLDKLIEICKSCKTYKMPDNKEKYKLINLNKLYNDRTTIL